MLSPYASCSTAIDDVVIAESRSVGSSSGDGVPDALLLGLLSLSAAMLSSSFL
jgi:hypothetical protein